MSDRTVVRCGAQSRSVAEEVGGVLPDVGTYLLLPVEGPWPLDVVPADTQALGLDTQALGLPAGTEALDPPVDTGDRGAPRLTGIRTLYYRPYPGRPADERPFLWDARRR